MSLIRFGHCPYCGRFFFRANGRWFPTFRAHLYTYGIDPCNAVEVKTIRCGCT